MKKRFLFAACAWLLCLGHAVADELVIGNITVPQGGTAELTVGYHFTSTTDKVGFTFALGLPEGIALEKDEDGEPVYVKDASINKLNIICAGEGNFGGQPSNETATIKGTEGTLLTLTLKADASLAVGSTHIVSVTKVTFQERVDGSVKDINLDDFSFTVTIGEPADTRVVLDETSTVAPTAAAGVDVRMKRTIKAGEWSTICLPFAMTEVQVKVAFGNDVQLGDFNDYDFDEDAGTISVKFNSATAIEANHPYIIKVGEKVTEFTVDGVDIDPQEAIVDFDTSRRHNQPHQMVGTYVANTSLDWGTLFLNDNQFWYSTGSTKMKAYRAYFNFNDLLPDFEDSYDSRRIAMTFGDEASGISVINCETINNNRYYDLRGRCVAESDEQNTLRKGLYIVNGKKVVK